MELPRIVSVDDHVVEPKTLWADRLPQRFLDVGPHVVRGGQPGATSVDAAGRVTHRDTGEGAPADWWAYEDVRMPLLQTFCGASYGSREVADGVGTTFEEIRPGCYEPAAHLDDMTQGNIEASVCFPNVLPRFCGQTFLWAKDTELAELCVRAYNDWILDEWCAPSSGRLVPLAIVPLWDAALAAEEVVRVASRGARAVAFSENPYALGLPSIHDRDRSWDRLFGACAETKTVVCIHVGSSSQMPKTAPDAPMAVRSAITSNNAMIAMTDWLFSGTFVRFPELKVALSEAQVGWIPYILERVDRVWETRPRYYDGADVPRPPSSYFASNMFGCMVSDQHGINSIHELGEDNVCFETDYPHTDSTWPDTLDVAARQLAGLSHAQVERVLRGNAIRLFSLDF